MADNQPLCFVLMPFASKKDPAGGPDIDFDRIYDEAIRPAIEEADMEPIRADEERTGGIIHRAMFERLLLCDFAVADLTTANANVFYELGVRHAVRPATTLPVFADRHMPPFDVNYLRALPYQLGPNNQFGPQEAESFRSALVKRLTELRELARRNEATDSPIFQLLTNYKAPDVAHLATDVFRDRARYSEDIKRRLASARRGRSLEQLRQVESELGAFDNVEAGVLVDFFLSCRAIEAYDDMIRLYERLPSTMSRILILQQQYGFALNRREQRGRAIDVLKAVLQHHGPSSETYGLLGRVYKDLFVDARKQRNKLLAKGHLNSAIDAYMRGFEADPRDAYPGINYVTLLDIRGDDSSLKTKSEVLPVVRFAVTQQLKHKEASYWDHATLLELAALEDREEQAWQHLSDAVAAIRESWEPQTTANNLRLIHDARSERGVSQVWLAEMIEALEQSAAAIT